MTARTRNSSDVSGDELRPLPLPTDRDRTAGGTCDEAFASLALDRSVFRQLLAVAASQRTSPTAFLLGAFAVLLYRISSQGQISISLSRKVTGSSNHSESRNRI